MFVDVNKRGDQLIGVILIDFIYMLVFCVFYQVENICVG